MASHSNPCCHRLPQAPEAGSKNGASVSNPSNSNLDVIVASETQFLAVEINDSRFYIDARLNAAGELNFEVVAVWSGIRSFIPGHEFFNAMMLHFGDKVKVVSSVWTDTSGFDTNLRIFNQETKRGTSNQDAAFATKTGRWVKDHGFTKIKSMDLTPKDFPGGYEQVLVEFER
jgi:hypothetical protein